MELYWFYFLIWEALEKNIYHLLMVDDNKIKRSVSILSGISSFTSLGSVAMSNEDFGTNNESESLWFNKGDYEKGDSGNVLTKTYVWSSSAGGSVMIEVDSRDSRTCGYVMMSAGVLYESDE